MTTVLVVDDSEMDRRLIGALVKKEQEWTVVYACDGVDAIGVLERERPDVIVTDMQMPQMDGLELLMHVKSEYPSIPVIVATAYGNEELAVEALRQGAASYVPKSTLTQRLRETIQQLLTMSDEDRDKTQLMDRMVASQGSFVLENSLVLMPSLVNYLQQPLIHLRICDAVERRCVGVALEEALKNAYEHGSLELGAELRYASPQDYYELAKKRSEQSPYRERKIHVTGDFSRSQAVYTIRDEGSGFDPKALPDPTDPANLTEACRGTMLMRTFMDEVVYNEVGNQVTLIKRSGADSP
ncbi:MAG: response regulator [Planctomycetes bacterium]|nr:response regulator [Planctomycetota bacterium]